MKVDLNFRELVYARYAISRRLDRTTHDYERNKRMFPDQIDNAAKFASMEAEMSVLNTVLHKLTLGVADCNIQDGLE